ncbi:hypothetical protein [Streptomyces sp. NPDC101206]|uniref:hypothetical protein n=1 Tax=Streptomyces sp. NPDC101206 TaxID=3366128 RepID=UPI00381C5055
MAEEAAKQQDDQSLWRAMFTPGDGWSPGVAFAGHLSAAAPALAEVNGVFYCIHRGARKNPEDGMRSSSSADIPVLWTSFDPAVAQPYLAARDKAATPLPSGASEAEQARWQEQLAAASAALDEVRRWTPDSPVVPGRVDKRKAYSSYEGDRFAEAVESFETPAIIADGDILRMIIVKTVRFGPAISRHLYELEGTRDKKSGEVTWEGVGFVETGSDDTDGLGIGDYAPALAAFNGQIHLLHTTIGKNFTHRVRGQDGRWTAATAADGKPLATPKVNRKRMSRDNRGSGGNANAALAVHDGKLHLVHRLGDGADNTLTHAVFDGTQWADKGTLPAGHLSSRTAGMASYDGKLHAVYPDADPKNSKLRHTWWTEKDGWADAVDLDGHDSDNAPALLAVKNGPACQEREALLMVHRGIDRWEPPKPPAPRPKAKVTDHGETVYGPWLSDEGWGGWSRLWHRTAITPALCEGRKVLILSWEAHAEYYWGFWYYNDHGSYKRPVHVGTVELRLRDSRGAAPDGRAFSFNAGIPDDAGRIRFDTVIDRPKAGTYTLSHRPGIEKTGGYWWTPYGADGHNDTNEHRWCEFTVNTVSKATITLT